MSVLQYFPQTSNMSCLFDQSVLCTLLILNNSHAMRNISLCHMNAIHIVVIVCYCSVGPLRRHHMNRILQELHDGNEWELLGHRE